MYLTKEVNLMKQSFLLAMAVIGTLGLLAPPRAQAQTPNGNLPPQPGIPTPAPPSVFPLNQPETFRYTDAQGQGSITFVDLGPDGVTAFDLLRVNITQNGQSFNGSGIATPIPGAVRPLTNLVTFTVTSSNGAAFFFEGKMGLGAEFQGQGTFHPVTDPTQTATWSLLFVPGTPPPTPGPISTTLSLSIDRGCGSSYPIGAPLVITYSAATNDVLTLRIQRSDGSQSVLFANLPVVGGQTYSLSTFVSPLLVQRTLILTDSSGTQVTCNFTAVNNR